MSTLSLSPAFVPGSAQLPRLSRHSTVALTQRGRVVMVLAFLAAAMVVMMTLSSWATATREGGTPQQVRTIQVQPGDTLYGIASGIAKPGKIRDVVLVAGQKLAIPTNG
jgi:hypothetical protein